MLVQSTADTIQYVYMLYTDGQYPEFFRDLPPNCSPEQALSILQYHGDIVQIVEEGVTVGFIVSGMNDYTRLVTIGVLILKEYQTKGYAAKAVKEAAELFFTRLNANKVVCTCSKDDKRTMYLLEKAKFLPEARLRDNTFYLGELHDEIRWALPRDRYFSLYPSTQKE